VKKAKKKSEGPNRKNLKPDGGLCMADAWDAHPDFEAEYLDAQEKHNKKHNPELAALMDRIKKDPSGADKDPT